MTATDLNTSEPVEDLRARLTRGGLSPEAVDKAADAYLAGDVHALNLAFYKIPSGAGTHLICPIPEELLTRVFPVLAKARPENIEEFYLEYEINRHRGGVQSITIRYPAVNDHEPDVDSAGFETQPEGEPPKRAPIPARESEPDEADRLTDPPEWDSDDEPGEKSAVSDIFDPED